MLALTKRNNLKKRDFQGIKIIQNQKIINYQNAK